MNKADRDALRAQHAAATPGPWYWTEHGIRPEDGPTSFRITGPDGETLGYSYGYSQLDADNCATATAAHNALPELLDAADRAERYEAALSPIFAAISAERDRQERLLVERNWKWSMATPGIEPALKLMPLMEEVGEVAHAVRRQDGFAVAANSHDNHGLRAELIQVAACAVAWVEAIDAEAREALAQPEEARE